MTRRITILAAVAALAVSADAASASAAATPAAHRAVPVPATLHVATTAQSNGIIMRDGGVCDPIRHMGC